jgi:uncharacterized cupin superfamily protein
VSVEGGVANVFGDAWDEGFPPQEGYGQRTKRLVPPGGDLGASVYELPPGQTQAPYHFHHGNEELLLVLRGRPTLRRSDGERELAPGDVVHFPKGPAGAHQLYNRGAEPARYVIAASHVSPELVEYPDSGKLAAMSRTPRADGQPLWTVHRLADQADYFEGEEPRA